MKLHGIDAGAGSPILLLHGLFGAAGNWGSVQKALATDHRVTALDLRNHGASPHAVAMDYACMAADVAETMDGPATVIGHSMGGKAAMMLALTRPDLVTRLVVADIAPVRYAPALRGHVAALQALPLRPGLTRKGADAALAPAVPEAGVRGFLLMNLAFAADPPAWRIGLDEIAGAMPDIEDFTPPPGAAYHGPTLFLTGGRSDYVRPEHHARIEALFPAVQFEAIPGAGHWVHAEAPQAFLDAVRRFLG